MSINQWLSTSSFGDIDWREGCNHIPLKTRTFDPEARDFDEAIEIFWSGVRCCRSGDLDQGSALLATSLLLDMRSFKFAVRLPEEAEAAMFYVDHALMERLITNPLLQDSYSTAILKVFCPLVYGACHGEEQRSIAASLLAAERLIEFIQDEPSLENGPLGGCMKQSKLHYVRSSLFMALGNHKSAATALAAAVKLEPRNVTVRSSLACLWAGLRMKDENALFQEFSRLAEYSHPDARHMSIVYGWLAHLTFLGPSLGTYSDAVQFWAKAKDASARHEELYGTSMMDNSIMKVVQQHVSDLEVDPSQVEARKSWDTAGNRSRYDATSQRGSSDNHYSCVACSKRRTATGGPLLACARCKLVRYCSKECQRKDWKGHKQTCKMMTQTRSNRSPLPEAPTPNPVTQRLTPQAPLDGGEELASQRVLQHIKDRWQQHGTVFSTWWKRLSKSQKCKYLEKITGGTLPQKAATPEETKKMLGSGNPRFRASVLTDYTMEFLLAPCQCAEHDNHGGRDQVLCEIYWKAVKWTKESEHADYEFCRQMVQAGVFPDNMAGYIATPPSPEDEHQVHKLVKFAANAPGDAVQKINGYIEAGLLRDGSTFSYLLSRCTYRWTLFALLFENLDTDERYTPPIMPLARLNGCEHCTRSCEVNTALNCSVCTVAWWCCQGCKMTSQHGRACPTGQASDMAILFR